MLKIWNQKPIIGYIRNLARLTTKLLSPDSLEEPTQVGAGDRLFLCKTLAGEASKLAWT